MNDQDIIDAASDNLSALRKHLRKRVRNITPSMIDDCVQEAFLWVMENKGAVRADFAARAQLGRVVLRRMTNAAGRFLYANKKANGAVSLSHPLGDDPDSAELGDMIVDATTEEPERAFDGRQAMSAISSLTSLEAKILIAFVEEVSIDDICAEHEMDIEEVLRVKRGASDKIKAAVFARTLTRDVFRPFCRKNILDRQSAA